MITSYEKRKQDHLTLALQPHMEANEQNWLQKIRLCHQGIPELDFQNISLQTPLSWCSHKINTPFFIAGMTAGHRLAPNLNHLLASCAEKQGWIFSLGSLRKAFECFINHTSKRAFHPDLLELRNFRNDHPSLCLLANLGISQLISASCEKLQDFLNLFSPDGLVIHFNPLQECLQPEGTPFFQGATDALKKFEKLSCPLLVKETGCGFSQNDLKKLKTLSHLKAVDLSGFGGTHWGRIEGARNQNPLFQKVAQTFAHWGNPLPEVLLHAKKILPAQMEIWASGGVRSGIDAAKLIAMGAHRVGYAKPALEHAQKGEIPLMTWMKKQALELRIALFCLGCQNPHQLRKRDDLWTLNDVSTQSYS